MPRTTLNKNQLDPLEIVNADILAGANIDTSKLAEGAKFIQRDGSVVFTQDQSMGGNKITNLGAPINPNDAVRLQDLQDNQAGLNAKEAVRVATTANITLSGPQTIDGVSVVAGNRVLVKNQSATATNGIYEVAAGAWTRTTDADTATELKSGTYVFVQEGTVNADSGWLLSTDGAITLGTTALTFVQFTGAGQISAGTGLTQSGNTLNVGTASSARIVVNADNIDLATVVTAGTGIKNTYDAYGRITSSAALSAGDIPTHTHLSSEITLLTGYTVGANAALATTDTLNAALGKLQGQVNARYTLPGGGTTAQYLNGLGALTTFPTTMAPSAHTLDSHSNVTISANSAGEILKWSGSAWINNTLVEAGIQALDANLTSLSSINDAAGGGFYAGTGSSTNALRTIEGTLTRISVANKDGVSGNPTIDLIPTAVSPGTYNNVTVDTYGRVTAGSNSGTAASDKYIVREAPTGLINGSNGTFTLANTPVANKEMVFLNGQLLEPGAGNDYTISGSTITILAPVPVAGDVLRVTYFAQ